MGQEQSHGMSIMAVRHNQLPTSSCWSGNGRLRQLCRMEGDLSKGCTGIPGKIIMGLGHWLSSLTLGRNSGIWRLTGGKQWGLFMAPSLPQTRYNPAFTGQAAVSALHTKGSQSSGA